jgi:hypothetical protein
MVVLQPIGVRGTTHDTTNLRNTLQTAQTGA